MDNISHVCVGHFLSHTHHDGRFFPTTYLGPYGIKLNLEKIAFQHPMKCKSRNMIWENDSLPWESAKEGQDGRHPHVDGWVWMMRKKLESYLQIYDTGQQEAWLRWLLLKEFGHHLLSKGMWQDTCIMGQQGVWTHCVDITFFMSITMFSLHDFDDGSIRRQKNILLLPHTSIIQIMQ